MLLQHVVQYHPANVLLNKNISPTARAGGSLMITVIPNAGTMSFQGRQVRYSLVQERGRFLDQVRVSDEVPGRVLWCLHQSATDDGRPMDRIEIQLTSVKAE